MLYVPFVHVNNDGKGLQLNQDISVENLTGSDAVELSDRIWIWNPDRSAYDRFFYYDDGSEAGWCDDRDMEYIEKNEGWENGIPAGQGLYFKAKGTGKSVVFGSPLD